MHSDEVEPPPVAAGGGDDRPREPDDPPPRDDALHEPLQLLLMASGIGVFRRYLDGEGGFDAQGRFIPVTRNSPRSWAHLSPQLRGLSRDGATATHGDIAGGMPAEDLASLREQMNQALREGRSRWDVEHRSIWPDGSVHWLCTSCVTHRDARQQPVYVEGIVRDITEQKRAQRELADLKAQLDLVLAVSGIGLYHHALEEAGGRPVLARSDADAWSLRIAELYGFAPQAQPTPIELLDRIHPDDRERLASTHQRALQEHQSVLQQDYRVVWPDGSHHWLLAKARLSYTPDGRPQAVTGIVHDITERKENEQRITHLATHDALTGLPNRALFAELVRRAIESGKRHAHCFALMFIDLDRFKIVNDTLGHEAGDELIRAMATRFRETLRGADVVARMGGDEFVVLAEESEEVPDANAIARKLLAAAIAPLTLAGQECRITASIGIALFPNHGADEQTLMKCADIAMYQAKEDGKNTHRFYTSALTSQSLERLTLESHLRQALERDEFSLHYQPKVDFASGRITGVEALLRWNSPVLGSVPPGQFIALAEDTGLIVPIGQWVLKTACAQAAAWRADGLPPVPMAVNVSARQFADDRLYDDIAAAVSGTCLGPGMLEIELTEGMVMHNVERAVRLLGSIQKLGVRVAIDDFGTGYSSLAQLRRFPVDTLKVDRSFVRHIEQDPEGQAITEAIIAMGRTLSLTVIAEGVETQAEADFLRAHACDEMQGFYFSRPVTGEAFARLLAEHAGRPPQQP